MIYTLSSLTRSSIFTQLIGPNYSHGRKLAHELMMDDDFKLSSHGMIIPNPIINKIIDLTMRSDKLDKKIEMEKTIYNISNNIHTDKDKLIVTNCLDSLNKLTPVDTSLLLQMIMNNTFDTDRFVSLVNHMVDESIETWGKEHQESIKIWETAAIASIYDPSISMSIKFSEIIYDLITEIKNIKYKCLNKSLNILKPGLKTICSEYERMQVLKDVEAGNFNPIKTANWLYIAKSSLEVPNNLQSLDRMKLIHRFGICWVLNKLSLQNKYTLDDSALPETLVMDSYRINLIRIKIRTLSFILSFIQLSKIPNTEYTKNILLDTDVYVNEEKACIQISEEFPDLKNVENIVKICKKSEDQNIRKLYVERMCKYVSDENETLHPSLKNVEEELIDVKKNLLRICSYIELIYAPIYIAILQ